ncbi:MAG TPA: hypothetical protein VK123_10665 [Candidatus Limnocylindrales bacterium]|nr:hypothetical protein [Candidatus Limnocylindrales bacterium]
MRRLMILAAFLTPLLVGAAPSRSQAADVGVSLRIGDRYQGDQLVFRERPQMEVVPRTHVYYINNGNADVYRYGGFYYANDSGRWYRARNYRGPWIYVRARAVPRAIYAVPTDYRRGWHGDYQYWRNRDYDNKWNDPNWDQKRN